MSKRGTAYHLAVSSTSSMCILVPQVHLSGEQHAARVQEPNEEAGEDSDADEDYVADEDSEADENGDEDYDEESEEGAEDSEEDSDEDSDEDSMGGESPDLLVTQSVLAA